MSVDYVLNAEPRNDVGKGASRRLRRSGKVPAVLYGAHREPVGLSLSQSDIQGRLRDEGFYSHILTLKIGDNPPEQAVLRDLQRHPYKQTVMLHMDFQRIVADEAIRVHVPLHFLNEGKCKGVRQEGGVISHLMIEVEVSCLPKDLPEYIEVDVAELGMNESIHLSELQLPPGVELTQLSHGGGDTSVVNVHHPKGAGRDEDEEEAVDEEGDEDDS